MDDKKYTMEELLAEYGDGFDKMEEEEEAVEEVIEEPKEKKEVLKDITIKCKKCEQDFVWTVKDQ